MFLCTANDLRGIPGPLQDRMEIIKIPGYTEHDKLQIARHYLVPKQIEGNGLEGIEVEFTDAALRRLVEGYTREAGVRNLEREVGGVCRKIARRVVRDRETQRRFKVRAKDVSRYLGPERFGQSKREERDEVGLRLVAHVEPAVGGGAVVVAHGARERRAPPNLAVRHLLVEHVRAASAQRQRQSCDERVNLAREAHRPRPSVRPSALQTASRSVARAGRAPPPLRPEDRSAGAPG